MSDTRRGGPSADHGLVAPRLTSSLLVVALTAACAAVQPPPGGPPDPEPPVLLSVTPDSGTVAEGLRDPVIFQFDEVIDEGSGGGLDRLILLSPAPEALDVGWKRKAIAVQPKGGWRPGTTYHVTLLPGVADLRGNRMRAGQALVFTTGGPIPSAVISGTVVDWEGARLAPRALVHAILQPDSLVYLGVSDSAADFRIGPLPPGRYVLAAILDANNNRRWDAREAFDSLTVDLDSVLDRTLWAFRQDTVGPSLSRATLVDSQTVRLEFSQALTPEAPDSGAVRVFALPDSQPVTVRALWRQAAFDSVRGTRPPAPPDSLGPGEPLAARGAEPAVAPDPERLVVPGPRTPVPAGTPGARAPAPPPIDTGRVRAILSQRPRLGTSLVVELDTPLATGTRYLFEADVANLNGARNVSRSLLLVPERAGRDSR